MKQEYKRILLLGLMALQIVACTEAMPVLADYKPGVIERTSKEFLIPRSLREEIESEYIKFLVSKNQKIILKEKEMIDRLPREFLDIEILMRSSASGVLKDHTRYLLPRGGGEIDLKNLVTGRKGSFFMKVHGFRSSEPAHAIKDLHVYFLSETNKRKIQNEKYGAGCKKFMDVTDLFKKSNDGVGLQLNATEQRYLSVVGGIFYFIEFDDNRKIYIAAVRITDSRYPELICE